MGISIQQVLIDKVKTLVPKSISLVEELSYVLGISIDSVYRRLRDETQLSICEVQKLCSEYKISFDSLCSETNNTVTFSYEPMKGIADCEQYFDSILMDLKRIKSCNDGQIRYSAVDIPLFHNFITPELANFKIYYWLRSVMNDDKYVLSRYKSNCISKNVVNLAQDVYTTYRHVPSTEIWCVSTITSLLKQIFNTWELGLFEDDNDVFLLYDQVKSYLVKLQFQAEMGSKVLTERSGVSPNDFKLYISDINVGNNCILTSVKDIKSVYLSVNTFRKIQTFDEAFFDATESWMNNIIKKSILISGVGEKHRQQFFMNALDQITAFEKRINR